MRFSVMARTEPAGIGSSQLERRHGSQSDAEDFSYKSPLLHVR